MKVVIINRSDALGGAAIASSRLCHALCQAGADARMLVLDRRTDDVAVQAVGTPLGNRYRFLAERLGIFLRNGFSRERLFLIDTATQGVDLSCHPWVREADVIVLGWINQAMLSLEGVARLASLGKPLVWVMHDMWNATGVCHHAEDCQGLNGQCEQCPLLPAGSRLAQRTWQRKLELYKNGDIHFVAVSNWLRKVCQESSLMRECDITVIPNAIDVARFDPVFLDDNPWGVEPGRQVVVMGAARLDDPGKGFDRLVAALRWLADHHLDAAQRLHLVLYGALRDNSLLDSIPVPFNHLGYVDDIQSVYRHAHIVVSSSTRESFGYTLVEGMACGCTAVTTGLGGQTDIVSHLKNGYVTTSLDPEELAEGLVWALDNNRDRQAQHNWIADKFDLPAVANRHLELYNQLLARK